MKKYENYLGLGIAGNFALHLAQAGELEEFKDIMTEDEAAPKGIFPFYLPKHVNLKDNLNIFPLSNDTIQRPKENLNIQAEPEVALVCKLEYENNKLIKITPTHFGAYNDCSIRVAGANKISDKKNWGKNSKGIAKTLLKIDKFENGGVMDNFNICSFLRRDKKLNAYGEKVELNGYSYFYEKLTSWMINKINTQENVGPLEPIHEYIKICNYPKNMIISIGATRYTSYGEKTFLKSSDEIIIVLYDKNKETLQSVTEALNSFNYVQKNMNILAQKVI